MTKRYAKSLPEYDEVEFDEEAVLKSRRVGRKMPTSVSLPPEVEEGFLNRLIFTHVFTY